jgi:hypothetical protein
MTSTNGYRPRVPFEPQIRALSQQLQTCTDDKQALKIVKELNQLLDKQLQHLREENSDARSLNKPDEFK